MGLDRIVSLIVIDASREIWPRKMFDAVTVLCVLAVLVGPSFAAVMQFRELYYIQIECSRKEDN